MGVSFLHVLAFESLQGIDLQDLSPSPGHEEAGPSQVRTAGRGRLWGAGASLGDFSWSV